MRDPGIEGFPGQGRSATLRRDLSKPRRVPLRYAESFLLSRPSRSPGCSPVGTSGPETEVGNLDRPSLKGQARVQASWLRVTLDQ